MQRRKQRAVHGLGHCGMSVSLSLFYLTHSQTQTNIHTQTSSTTVQGDQTSGATSSGNVTIASGANLLINAATNFNLPVYCMHLSVAVFERNLIRLYS